MTTDPEPEIPDIPDGTHIEVAQHMYAAGLNLQRTGTPVAVLAGGQIIAAARRLRNVGEGRDPHDDGNPKPRR